MSSCSPFQDLSTEKLVLLARHLARVSGFLTVKMMSEYFPSIDTERLSFIADSLVASNHVRKTSNEQYEFVDLSKDIVTAELNEELKVLAELKGSVLKSVCVPSTLDAGPDGWYTEKKAREIETVENTGNSTLFHTDQAEQDTHLTHSLPNANLNGSDGKVASLPKNTVPLHKSIPERNQNSTNAAVPSFPTRREQIVDDSFFDVEFERKLNSCVRPPPPTDSLSIPSAAPSSTVVSNHKRLRSKVDKFHWTKQVTGDEVRDPCRALEVYCELNNLTPPAYTVTYMPKDKVYYCLVLVGFTSFKSYPTMALTTEKAMEVAAERAVKGLSITKSMIPKKSPEQTTEN